MASHTYVAGEVEYYMSDEQKEYIRPGLTTEIVSTEIPADRKPVVELTFVDDMGLPLDRAGRLTPGPITASFVLAWWDNELRQYTSYTVRTQTSPITGVSAVQAAADSGGSWEDLEIGRARYTFGTVLPDENLLGHLIHADQRSISIIWQLVDFQYIFHLADKSGIGLRWNTPLFL